MIKQLGNYVLYITCNTQISRTLFTSSAVLIPRNFGETFLPKTTKPVDDNEVSTVEEVEKNLFGDPERVYKSVNSNELLKRYKKEVSPPKKERKILATQNENNVNKPVNFQRKESPLIKNTELNLEYIKLSLNDPLLSNLILTAKSRKYRDKKAQIVVEGRRLILDALKAGIKMHTLLFSQKDQLALIKDNIQKLKDIKIFKVPSHNLKAWSTLTTCPGLLAIFERPNTIDDFLTKSTPLPITVVCDNVREPSNLGSIIRSCAAVPCAQVVVLKGCCDPWETKALRGGCGGQFRVNIKDDITWEDLGNILPDNFSVFIAENNLKRMEIMGKCPIITYTKVGVSNTHNVLVIGGETHGISDDAYEFLEFHKSKGSCLHIPLAEGVDSLNTASALTLILFEMRKLLLEKQLTENLLQEEAI